MNSLRQAFLWQARACETLESPFLAKLMTLAADRLQPGTAVADRLLDWQGNLGPSGQSVPLRFAGALHGVARSGHSLAQVYPPFEVSDDALWTEVETALNECEATLLEWLDSPPQTNEVRRSAALIPAMHMLATRFRLPICLSELGASAGLNLRADRFFLEASGTHYGDPTAKVRLAPDWTGPAPDPADVTVLSRAGVDLNPVDPAEEAERLFAYLWADQPYRIALTEAAIETAMAHPADVHSGDAIEWLAGALEIPRPDRLHLIYHTVAWQYFPADVQARGEALFEAAGRKATENTPIARFAMETDGGRGAGLSLQVWPDGATIPLGRADFHGRWIEWSTPCLSR